MNPVEPELCNVIMGKGQEEYRDLPAFVDEQRTVTKWKFTAKEIKEINKTGHVYIAVFNQGQHLQPLLPSTVISDVLTAEQFEAIATYETVEVESHAELVHGIWKIEIREEEEDGIGYSTCSFDLSPTPCPICGAEPGEYCWKGMINDDEVMKWKIHRARLR